MQPSRTNFRGFTLIELLTVIAIIAILAAIIFPVFGRAREQTRQTNCMTNLHEIWQGVRLYREDNGKFPAALLGFVQSDINAGDGKPNFYTGTGNPIPIERLSYRPLKVGQGYIKDKINFICPDSPNNDASKVTTALYPSRLRPLADGAGPLDNTLPVYTDLIKENCCDAKVTTALNKPIYYYTFDSYDIGPRLNDDGTWAKDGTGANLYELHYSLDWSGNVGKNDYPNQLKYPDPPQDRTIVTWCTYHSGVARSDNLPVLMLSGKVSPVQRTAFYADGVLNFPRP